MIMIILYNININQSDLIEKGENKKKINENNNT